MVSRKEPVVQVRVLALALLVLLVRRASARVVNVVHHSAGHSRQRLQRKVTLLMVGNISFAKSSL